MPAFITPILSYLNQQPGQLLYHLAMAAMLASLIILSVIKKGKAPNQAAKSVRTGFIALLSIQVIAAILCALSPSNTFLSMLFPSFDRAVFVASNLIAIALWMGPLLSSRARLILASAIFVTVIAFSFSLAARQRLEAAMMFNNTWLDVAWSLLLTLVAVTGNLLIVIKKPAAWVSGTIYFAILAAGSALHLLFGQPDANIAGLIRLGQLAAVPFLLSLVPPARKPEVDPSAVLHTPLDTRLTAEDIAGDLPSPQDVIDTPRPSPHQFTTAGDVYDSPHTGTTEPIDRTHETGQARSQEIIATLEAENARLRAALEVLSSSPDQAGTWQDNQEVLALRQRILELEMLTDQLGIQLTRQAEKAPALAASEPVDRELVPILARDLRQPMSAIFGYTELLLGDTAGVLGTSQRHYIERIKSSMERMASILDDLTHLSAVDLSGFRITDIRFSDLLDQATARTAPIFRGKSLSIRLQSAPNLPVIRGDYSAIMHVLVILLKNAADVSAPDSIVRIQVDTRRNEKESYLAVQVTDSGGGIPLDLLDIVFTRKRGEPEQRIPGLGNDFENMMIAKSLVDAHGGRIWAESQIGVSTTFTLLLPTDPFGDGSQFV